MSDSSATSPLVAFVSSPIDATHDWARGAARDVLSEVIGLRPYVFEFQTASEQSLVDSYLRIVESSDLFVWLVGPSISVPVIAEVRTALQSGKPLLIFRISTTSAIEAEPLIAAAGVKYHIATTPGELREKLRAAVVDWTVRSVRSALLPRPAYLRLLLDASARRCSKRWRAAGMDDQQAAVAYADLELGRPPDTLSERGFHILVGSIGSGKSLVMERLLAIFIAAADRGASVLAPIIVDARELQSGVVAHVESELRRRGALANSPVALLIDALDEAPQLHHTTILAQSLRVAEGDDRNVVVVAARLASADTSEFIDYVVQMPALETDEVLRLMSLTAQRPVDIFELEELPSAVYEAVRTPLFALLAGGTMRDRRTTALSVGLMLHTLVQGATSASKIATRSTNPLFRRLAVLSLRSETGTVHPERVAPYNELNMLLASGLVTESGGRLSFPLAILADWFAAQALAAAEVELEEVLNRAERWRTALFLFLQLEGVGANAVLEAVARQRPALAASAISQYRETEDSWSDSNAIASQLLQLAGAFAAGLQPLSRHLSICTSAGEPRPLVVHAHGAANERYVQLAWLARTAPPLTVSGVRISRETLPPPWKLTARPWRSTWHIALSEVRDALKELVSRRFVPDEGPLLKEAAYSVARSAVGRSALDGRPIPLAAVLRALNPPVGASPSLERPIGKWRLAARDIDDLILPALVVQDGQVLSPSPPPDREPTESGSLVIELYSDEQILLRTQYIYESALHAYSALVAKWLPRCAPDLPFLSRLPALLEGVVVPDSVGRSRPDRFASMTYRLLPSESRQSVTALRLGNAADEAAFLRAVRADRWGVTSSVLCHLSQGEPVAELVWKWLIEDFEQADLL